ncbi:uncharacterized protein A4U43_C05F8580 [Asparagus officinalis]|uniref:Uncharacterized protein n=1 Tax=Asparagus officinalis TaxID=4686 RepID=A0A5P1EVP2_ASPOF|nr:uncharacterized protein A4U43_C05F8580 [Asparagus officinalis]
MYREASEDKHSGYALDNFMSLRWSSKPEVNMASPQDGPSAKLKELTPNVMQMIEDTQRQIDHSLVNHNARTREEVVNFHQDSQIAKETINLEEMTYPSEDNSNATLEMPLLNLEQTRVPN